MRAVARLASVEVAPLFWVGTTCRARDSEYLLWSEFFSHGRGTIPQTLWRRRHASAHEVTTMIPAAAFGLLASLAGVLPLAKMGVELSVDGSSCLRQLANDLTLRWKLFVAVLTNSKPRHTISLLHDSELAFRHLDSFP